MNNKNNNEKKNINKEEKKMAKAMKKITVSMANGQIMITKIDGKAVDEPRRFGVYTKPENGTLPHISIRPKVGGWLELDVKYVNDENGIPINVEPNHEPKAYWAFVEQILGGKKAVKQAIKATIELRKSLLLKKAEEAKQMAKDNNGMIIGATKTGYIYQKPMAGAQEETIDLGKFGKRTLRYGKGLECSKVLNGDKEVAYIFWQKSGDSPKIRILSEKEKHYYMLSYDQTSFIYFQDKKRVVVMDSKLANALWFFHKNFVVRLAELKNWKLPTAHKGMPKEYWDSLEKEYEAEETARTTKKKA